MLGVILTALYMTRQIIYVFLGNQRATQHPHESPPVMTRPLIVLALATIGLSVVLTPAWPWLHDFLSGERAEFRGNQFIQPALLTSFLLVAAGIALGFVFYRKIEAQTRPIEMDPLQNAQPALFRFLENKMWIDEIYRGTIIRWSKLFARISDWLDRYFWDGLVRAFGSLGQLFGIVSSTFDERGINPGVDETTVGARRVGRLAALAHSGQIQIYLGVIAIGMLALLLIYAWLA
jgi:NADH-quinone oxidoreductase subunit L